jgi:dUTP pyrophosphatase
MTETPKLNVSIQLLDEGAEMPSRAHSTDACFDLRASKATVIREGETGLVSLGWAMELEQGWEARVRGRSGLASKGIVAHHGTIDHLYRQEVKVILHNFSGSDFQVKKGDRIAQLTFSPVYAVELSSGEIQMTSRGGFGSTGVS